MTDIPDDLRNLNQWLCWQKPTKIPINPRTGINTKAPRAAWSYEECITVAAEKGYGIGFSLKNGIFGVDLDHVLDETGNLKPEYSHFSALVDKIGSYTEISPSGEGLHIFARCDDTPPECRAGTKRKGNVEMYCEGRYFTVTGNAWEYPGVLRTISADEYREIHTLLFGGTTPACPAIDPPQEPDIDTTRKYEEVILMWEEKEAEAVRTQMTMSNIPHEASEAMMSIMTRIAGDAAFKAAYGGIPYDALATPACIRKLWEESETYRTEYATGEHEYNDSKIQSTLDKAISAGRAKYDENVAFLRLFGCQLHTQPAKPKPIAPPPKPPATKHPEGFCISPDDVPEFWCRDYDHPLRYHLAYIAKYALEVAMRPRPIVAWITAVVFGAALCGRQYTAFGGRAFSRMYVIISAPSGAGKGDIRGVLRNLIAECHAATPKMQSILADARNWTSDAAVHASIALTPQSVAVWDECGHKIKHMATDSIAMSVLTELTEAFSEAGGILDPKRYADNKKDELKAIPIFHPAMSVIGLGTPEQLSSITEDMIADGRFSRWLYINIPGAPVRLNEADISTIHLNPETAEVINTILKTATMRPETTNELSAGLVKIKQEITKRLEFDPESPKSWADIDYEYQQRIAATEEAADRAVMARALEIASAMAISRTLLGTAEGIDATKITYEALGDCLSEVDASMDAMHDLWTKAEVFTQREERIAKEMAEIFANTVKEPYYRVYWSPAMADALKKRGITIGGYRDERTHIEDILLADYHIAAGKEGNMLTGRKYYYDTTNEHAQAFQGMVDLHLKNGGCRQASPGTEDQNK